MRCVANREKTISPHAAVSQLSCMVSSITFPFIRFRNPCPHCRSVAPLPFPYRVRSTDRTGTEKLNSILFERMNGNVMLETRHQSERCRHYQPAIQTGHTRDTHAHLLGDDDEAVCTTCYTSLTVNHILIECRPQFNHIANFGRTLKDLFNNTNVSAYNRCSTFLF